MKNKKERSKKKSKRKSNKTTKDHQGWKRTKRFFVRNYLESWDFLKESKNFIYFVFGVFILFALFGFFIPAPESVAQEIMKIIQEILEITKGMTTSELIGFIFWNNVKVSFIGMISGILFGVIPFFETIINGYLLGFVASHTVMADGIASLWRIFPHGIFELPAVFISLGIGIRLGLYFFQKKQRQKRNYKEIIVNSLRLFVFVIIPLLIIAAVIEGFLISFYN
ncbi:hypothetical protein GF378_01990 [Candidatus Pacearchaeota archaeon]|nr:hypothetical protein [Candidatus Pacearchaeota archaeon]